MSKKSKSDLKWDAILAKNLIARHIGLHANKKNSSADKYILARLKEIERYIGEANLPSAEASFKEAYGYWNMKG